MTSSDFEYFINQIGYKIGRKDTTFRDAISAKEILAVTLRFLASGDSYLRLTKMYLQLPTQQSKACGKNFIWKYVCCIQSAKETNTSRA